VDEERSYQEWGKGVDSKSGIMGAKRALNLLHGQLAEEGFSQVYVDQMDPNVVAVTRHSPSTHQSVILVAHTAFGYPSPNAGPTGIRPLRFEGVLDEIILEASLTMQSDKPFDRPAPFKKDPNVINGFTQFQLSLQEHIPLAKSTVFQTQAFVDGNNTQLNFTNLRPGTVVAIRVSMHPGPRASFDKLQKISNARCPRPSSSGSLSQPHPDTGATVANACGGVCPVLSRSGVASSSLMASSSWFSTLISCLIVGSMTSTILS